MKPYPALLLLLFFVFPSPWIQGQQLRLEYEARYEGKYSPHSRDHLMLVEKVLDHHALVSSNLSLTLLDLEALTPAGTMDMLDRISDIDAHGSLTRPDGYVYVNLRIGGFAIVHLDQVALDLTFVGGHSEPGVYYEKMSLVGDRLYVSAHKRGIRIFDLADPASPQLIGSLEVGFEDAWDIAVDGNTAYVADGPGGLKIVDITDETAPVIVDGENLDTAVGTAEDALVVDGDVYVACGSAGVALYPAGLLAERVLHDTPRCAIHLAHEGGLLAVGDIGGVRVLAIQPDGTLLPVTSESAYRRELPSGELTRRVWHGVAWWGSDRLLVANWDTMDIYRLWDLDAGTQPDVTVSAQRLRFPPAGGVEHIDLVNQGCAPLVVSAIDSSQPTFTVQPSAFILQPGESTELEVQYAGGLPGGALLRIHSNDPDENPLPIQVFGETHLIDPGEPALPFVLQSWEYDHDAGGFTYSDFDFDVDSGKVFYFMVFGTW